MLVLPIQPLNDVVGVDTSLVFTREFAIGESLLNTVSNFFIPASFSFIELGFLTAQL